MRKKLEALMNIDLSAGDMYLLVRQLVKSLPYFGASQDEICNIRGLAEEIEHTFPSSITEDIRAEVHSKLSPRNLDLVRALLSYGMQGDPEPLMKINKYQKVFRHPPERFREILGPLEELERELSNVFEPHPGRIEDRISAIYQLLRNTSQIVSPEIDNSLRYLADSMEKKNSSLIKSNFEMLLLLLEEAVTSARDQDLMDLFRELKTNVEEKTNHSREGVLALADQWRRKLVSLFFPSLLDSLEEFVTCIRAQDALKAALMLGEMRMSPRYQIINPSLPPELKLEAIWLDLTLERIGYILFGEVNNVILADITIDALPVAIDVMHSMVLNVCAKGLGTQELEAYSNEVLALKDSSELNFYTAYSVVERINAEIGAIADKIVRTYDPCTREIFKARKIPHAEEAASAFVDGLFRETTLQHLSELSLKLLNFSRTRIAELMKRVRHPPIREISPAKVARIKLDLDKLTVTVDPSRLAYFFRPGAAEGSVNHYPLLGEKGAYLAEMARLGLNVPAGFTLTSKVCNMFFSDGHVLHDNTRQLLFRCIEELEKTTGCELGSPGRPLLLAVRAGSCVSMPGMMDTILNIGLNDETVEGLSRTTGDALFAYECYFRLISKYSSSVMGIPEQDTAAIGGDDHGCSQPGDMHQRVKHLLEAISDITGNPFPQDPREQLIGALSAIFSSWHSDSAIMYRQIFNIPHSFCTAATIQQMVFGNLGQRSCSGVAFSRNPISGERHMFGEYLPRSQGETLVCGRGNPLPLSAFQDPTNASLSLEYRFPQVYGQLEKGARRLESHLGDMQDIEFTIQDNMLYFLQTRAAKRTDHAALKIAIDLADEGIIEKHTAVSRLEEAGLKQLFLPSFSPRAPKVLMTKGNPASPGVATGRLAFTRKDAIMQAQAGEEIVLAVNQSVPEDIAAIAASKGVLTREGGMTSHAAINSRRMAKPCVTGCQALMIDTEAKVLRVNSHELGPNDVVSIDGSTGEVFLGAVEIVEPQYLSGGSEGGESEVGRYYHTYKEWKRDVSGEHDTQAEP
jgi:phosphohistidine swiveling domain-containing protein